MPATSTPGGTEPVTPVNSNADLEQSLAEETAELESLLALLRGEQAALRVRDMEQVHALAIAKRERLVRLSAFDSARRAFLQTNRLSQDHAGMLEYIERVPGHRAAVSNNWRRLLANAAEARRINAVNGKLIANQLHYVAGALSAMRQSASHLLCYGADGHARGATRSNTLASA